MSGVTLTFDAQDALSRLWDARTEMMRPAPLLRSMGERLLEFHQQRFQEQKSPDGIPWEKLKPRYQLRKRKNADKVLTRDGYLRNTLRWQVNADELLFGTNRVYGAIHQFGGTIEIAARSQQAYYRQKKNGKIGNQFVRKSKSNHTKWHTIPAYKIKIEARPWLGVSKSEGETLIEMAKNYLQGAFN
ncbi:TPA: phage virion morphogenesis protein [Klebsiella pneumoniae]|nr:phage virion morphogenesis protein [Klebsiella pneumoniae]HCD2543707.1 phage virion morphogenesis protein [Klebsiella pneumoniae]HCD3711225.1 phage virion morphogenesis protein [Klebsiella pneumoniae]HCD4731700.1 phage virion morphogenesis protein [Klebsiella pneumoniae]HCD6824456.1 phage virion morphogenesis protein [Klebsiella pneumoniae]